MNDNILIRRGEDPSTGADHSHGAEWDARARRAPFEAALIGVAAIALEEQLHVLPATQTTNRSNITSHCFS